jgi:RNA polymerase sigma-70 factor (ECF subfamily)
MDGVELSVNELAKVCAHSSNAAEWEEFLRRCNPLASLIVARVVRMWTQSASPAIVEDILQEVFLKLCEQNRRILREFEAREEDSFLALLRIISGSVANDYFRRLNTAKRGGKSVTSSLCEDTFPVHSSGRDSKELQQAVLLSQLDRMMLSSPSAVSDRDRRLFWLYFRQGFTAEEIAGMTGSGLTPKGVESALRRVSKWIKEEMEERRSKVGT